MDPAFISDQTWRIGIDRISGGVVSISRADQPAGRNWVCSPDETPWLPSSKLWGLGVIGLEHGSLYGRAHWERCDTLQIDATSMRAVYHLKQGFTVTVDRRLIDGEFEEAYTFSNTGYGGDHSIGGSHTAAWGVYLPFNDNYPDAATCLTRRCHAHLWCGGASSWVNAMAMDATAPHLGMVLTAGGFAGYSVQERDADTFSHVRGAMLFHPDRVTVPAGGSTTLSWRLFWHDGWEGFWRRLEATPGFVRLSAPDLSVTTGTDLTVTATGDTTGAMLVHQDQQRPWSGPSMPVRVTGDGQQVVTLRTARGEHRLHGWGRPAMPALIRARLAFIRQHQREDAGRHAGAYLCYDNPRQTRFADPRYNGELIGMGVMAALWQQREPDPTLLAELHTYAAWVERCWLMPNGDVRATHFEAGMDHLRLYSYGWAAHWLAEYAAATNTDAPLHRALEVLEAYHRRGGAGFYAIGVPYLRLHRLCRERGLAGPAARVAEFATAHATRIAAIGTAYPKHEVNFEQTIVGPAVEILLNAYLIDGNEAWRTAAREHQRLLDAFNGQQPDHRLNDIAIRHWDGYWGGEDRLWGDTFPHYWSGLTGWISWLWSQAGDGAPAAHRARHILLGNASLYQRSGSATAVHVYPITVDGRSAAKDDRAATDQDWPLVWWLMLDREGCP